MLAPLRIIEKNWTNDSVISKLRVAIKRFNDVHDLVFKRVNTPGLELSDEQKQLVLY